MRHRWIMSHGRMFLDNADRGGGGGPPPPADPPAGNGPTDPPSNPPPGGVTFTQEQVNSMMADLRRQLRDAERERDAATARAEQVDQRIQREVDKAKNDVLRETGDLGTQVANLNEQISALQQAKEDAEQQLAAIRDENKEWERIAEDEYQAGLAALPPAIQKRKPADDTSGLARRRWLHEQQQLLADLNGEQPPSDPNPGAGGGPPSRRAEPGEDRQRDNLAQLRTRPQYQRF